MSAAVKEFSEAEVGGIEISTLERRIDAVRKEISEVRIGIDSGAELSVWPEHLFYPNAKYEPSPESDTGTKRWGPGDSQ